VKKIWFLSLLVILICLNPAMAEIRNALVIGNGSYQQVGALSNPPNDARLMAETLRELDFEVIEVIDASQIEMKRAIRDFGTRLNEAGREGIGLFYYAGHGVQVDGANYIIPVNAQINKEGDVDIEAVNANSVLGMMEYSNSRLNFVILDACRNNPYSRGFRSATRGLAKMSAPTGSFIAYATSPGDVAVDGAGENSPYTAALVENIKEPGVPIEKVFREVRNEVRSKTNNQQTPWESSSLIGGDFYFKTTVEVENTDNGQQITVTTEPASRQQLQTQGAGASTVTTPSYQPVVIKNDSNIELVFWNSVKDSGSSDMLQAYIDRYPEGIFVDLASLKMTMLDAQADFDSARDTQTAAPQPQTTMAVVAPSSLPASTTTGTGGAAAMSPESDDRVSALLKECSAHFKANRLTTGRGGNALDCYSDVLKHQPGNPDALAGFNRIEQKYVLWASVAMDRGDIEKAAENIQKLRGVNAENRELLELDRRLDGLIDAVKPASKAVVEEPAPKPAVAAAQPVAPAAEPGDRCRQYVQSGRLSGRGGANAWSCYSDMLAKNPGSDSARDGLREVEEAIYARFKSQIAEKSLRQAKKTMRNLKSLNPDSSHLDHMDYLYNELKMEMRW
jgi:hypothetical protein